MHPSLMPAPLGWLATVLAALLPALVLAAPPATAVIFYAMVLLSLGYSASRIIHGKPLLLPQDFTAVSVALALPLLAMAASALYHRTWHGSDLEWTLRFVLAIPIFWWLSQVPPAQLRHMQWGLIAGACVGSAMVIVIMAWLGLDRGHISLYGSRYNAVTFANLTLLFGLSSLLTLGWQLTRYRRTETGLKLLAAALGLYASLLSETRSCWIALPLCALIACAFNRKIELRWKLASILGLILAMVLAILLFAPLEHRLLEAVGDVRRYFDGSALDTSGGIRLQLWHASLIMFSQDPLFGIGGGPEFRLALQTLADHGVVTQMVAANFGEPHNDFLAAMAHWGIPGLAALCALYLLPAFLFWRRARRAVRNTNVAVSLGLMLCMCFAAFSVTEYMFRGMRTVPLYSVLVVALLAMSRPGTGAGHARTACKDAARS